MRERFYYRFVLNDKFRPFSLRKRFFVWVIFMSNKIISFITAFCLLVFICWLFFFNSTTTDKNFSYEKLLVKNGSGLGSDLYVPEKPKRIVFLNSSSFEIWVKLGGAKKIVGVPKFPSVADDVYSQLDKNVVILPNYSSFSIEKILLLKPDLVIMNGNEKRLELIDSFKQAKIPFMTLPSRSLEDIFFEIDLFGKLLDKQDIAGQEISRMKSNIAKNKDKHKDKPQKKVLMVFGTSESFFMATAHSRQGELLQLAGGENILTQDEFSAKDKFVSLSLEYIAKKDPDFILFVNRGPVDKMTVKIREALTENQAWGSIRAVRENKTYILPQELFSINPGLRADMAVEYLSSIFYEER